MTKTHNIQRLFETLENTNIKIPKVLERAGILTEYAVKSRYPGENEPVTRKEYNEAVKLSEKIFKWAKLSIVKEGRLF